MEGIDEQAKQEIISDLGLAEAKMQELKQTLETAKELTLQELKAKAKELETAVKEVNKIVRKKNFFGAAHKIHNAGEMLTKHADRIQTVLDKDAVKQAEFGARLEEARAKIKELAAIEQTIKDQAAAKNFESAGKIISQAHNLIKQAHKNLQSIIKDLRAKSGEAQAEPEQTKS